MKIGKKRSGKPSEAFSSSKPARNQSKKSGLIIALVIITALLITWVYTMGLKATSTVQVCMLANSVYKNQQITSEMLIPYDMVQAEFEKYSIVNKSGEAKRRIVTWEEKDKILGAFAAYPLQENTLLEIGSLYLSRVDNSDSVLYSFPGKDIVSLDIGTADLRNFKTFLEPGDRINITATYTEEEEVVVSDGYGGTKTEKMEYHRSEVAFQDILVADLLNSDGESILDIYADYNEKTVSQQAALSNSESFQESVEPQTLLVALTIEERDLYYYYLGKGDIEFHISLPQRVE